ncbi:hypothetical protein RhiirC2_789793 [Rhizophagus irregularis]|uniref:Uncharacterized protein n=1 Tax=Rhizophagus irregularis TaxID=588596 RepID=A0A2N1MMF4_9GLOM|nr:hypothetical protein RhiirC2_789793 [Rhizophagus irregularis]
MWDAKAENGPTAKELFQELKKLQEYQVNEDDSDIKSQVNEYDDKIKLNRTSEKRSNNIQTHPQAIYISRLLNFKNLPEPVNSGAIQSTLCNFRRSLDESDLNEMNQDDENDIE